MTKQTRPRPSYSVVVPVYESDHSVRELVERLVQVFETTLAATYEVILVDDGSRSPATWSTLTELTRSNERVTAIRLMRNYGKPGAVLCGLGHARGQWIITIDDDLQQRPEDIPELVKYQDHDVVVANFTQRRHGLFIRLSSWVKSKFDRIILKLPCKMSPLKLFKAEVAAAMLQVQTAHPFIPALLAYATKDFVPVEVTHEQSRHGRSRYNFYRRCKQASNLIIGNSSLLLRALGAIGGGVAFSGFGFAVFVVARKLVGRPIQPGWASLVVINLVFGGLIPLALSIIGEYLIRILEGTSQKPPYIVRQIIGGGDDT
jgi:dolichol-phosphate mannosyltransferase/undecaprenyl-phosphate 4-deoxy-4-formamido-L-arabinose transferase